MSLSALMKRMAEAGAPIEAIIMACEAVEAEQARIAGDREKAAQRKRNQRARERDDSVTVTGLSRDAGVTVVSDPPLSRPPNENISNPPTHTPPDITSRARADDFPRLECASPAVWRDFLKNRGKKNLPNTASAHRKLVRELAAMVARTGWPPGKVFESCVEQGWGAIYETPEMKGDTNGRSNQNIRAGGGNGIDRRDGIAKACDRILAEHGQSAGQARRRDDAGPANLRLVAHARTIPI